MFFGNFFNSKKLILLSKRFYEFSFIFLEDMRCVLTIGYWNLSPRFCGSLHRLKTSFQQLWSLLRRTAKSEFMALLWNIGNPVLLVRDSMSFCSPF